MQLLQADEIQIVYAIRYKGGNEWDIFRLFCHDFAGFNILQNILQDFRRELLDFKDMEAFEMASLKSVETSLRDSVLNKYIPIIFDSVNNISKGV